MPELTHHAAPATRRRTPGRAGVRLAALITLVVGCWLAGGTAAHAEDPFPLPDELVDQVGVMEDEAAVRAAQERLFEEADLQLFVVYVDNFGGLSGPEWADQTAELSHLGDRDLLVAVATGERSWGDSVAEGSGLSEGQLDDVAAERIEPALREDDWDGAAIGAAEGYLEAANAPSRGWVGAAGVGGVALLGYGAFRGQRWLRQRREQAEVEEAIAETAQRVGGQLVALDTALTAAEGELQYAEAEFAPEVTAPFREALTTSRQESLEAFGLQEQIAGQDPGQESDSIRDRYRNLEQLIHRAGTRLDEHATAFNELRALADRAPQRIEELTAALAGASSRVNDGLSVAAARADLPSGQRAGLEAMGEQARVQQGHADRALAQARERVEAGEPEDAVLPLKAAEEALAGLTARADQLSDLDVLLAQWRQLLTAAADSLTQDVADAERLAPQDPAVNGPAQEARAALAQVGDGAEDPVELAEGLGDIERRLDAALVPYREAEERRLKEVKAAQDQLVRTESRVRSMESELAVNRSYATATALTRASEARALLTEGRTLLETDPAQAHTALRDAASRAASALNSIHDVRHNADTSSSSGGWGSTWSASRSRSRSSSRRSRRSSSSSRSRSRSRSSSRRSSRSSRSSRGGRF